MRNKYVTSLSVLAILGIAGPCLANAQQAEYRPPTPSRIVDRIDNTNLVILPGHVLKAFTPDRDMGLVEESLPVRLYLSLKRSPTQQADLDALMAAQQNPKSPMYHKWLTPEQFGARFGASESDIQKVREWLEGEGFEVTSVAKNASVINVKITAASVRETFHAQLHYWNFEGGKVFAPANEPRIPAALAGLVGGIAGLNNLPMHTHHTPIRQAAFDEKTHEWSIVDSTKADGTGAQPHYNAGNSTYLMTPQDYYTIYNVNPTYTAGNHGEGSTIAIVAFQDFNFGTVSGGSAGGTATGGDATTFRNLFGITTPLKLKVQHGNANFPCSDPGGDGGEFALDTEWSGALAPAANLILYSCGNATTAIQAIVDDNIADVISSSIGTNESNEDSGDRQTTDTALAQAATQGQTYLSAQGDSGSDDADFGMPQGVSGLSIDYPGSSPLVLSIGGTDFQDQYDVVAGSSTPQSTYWSDTNSKFYGDALSYVPETTWNGSCGSPLIAVTSPYGGSPGETTATYCNSNGLLSQETGGGGGGGISSLYAQPSWQTGIPGLNPSITQRVTPDVSMFSSGGTWGHSTVLCDSGNPNQACTSPSTFGTSGGTSFAAPEFAGILALLRTGTGSRQGLVQPALYALAKAQYNAGTACYANGQTANTGITTSLPASTCIFHDVTTSGNNNECEAGTPNCFTNQGASYGVFTSAANTSTFIDAYAAGAKYDIATGLGSVNVTNMINKWNTAFTSSTSLKANPTSITSSQSTTLTATVTGGTPPGYDGTAPALTGSVNFVAGSTKVGSCTLSGGTCSTPVAGTALASGSNSVTATFVGSAQYPSSTSSVVTVTVTGSATTATPAFNPGTGTYSGSVSVMITDATTGSSIYYTTDGSTPTTSSTPYAGAINVTATETIKAIAVASSVQSAVGSATYTITASGGKVPPPIFTPGTGTFTTAHAVTITDATSGTTIYYTTNGSTPTTSSTKYTGPVTVSKNETIKAIAVSGSTQSAVSSATYEITKNVPAPTFTPAAGTYTKTQSVTITDLTRGATIYYTTNGSTPTTSSTKYTGAITVSSTKTIKALGVASGYGNSPVATATYTIK